MEWIYLNATADIIFITLAIFAMFVGGCLCRSLWRIERHLRQLKDAFWLNFHEGCLRDSRREEERWLRR